MNRNRIAAAMGVVECSGDETGPVIITVDGTGTQYDLMPVLLSTRGSGVVPKARITEVQEY